MTTTITVPSEAWLQQVNQVVRIVLSQQTQRGTVRRTMPNTYSAIVLVETTEEIPARSGLVLGAGGCQLLRIDSNDQWTVAYHTGTTNPVTETLYNPFTSAAIANDTMVLAGREIVSGKLIAISEDCG